MDVDEQDNFYRGLGDPANALTSHDALLQMKTWEKTVEIIGICMGIDDSRRNVFKFLLRNSQGDKVQVLAWEGEGRRVQGYVKVNYVVHINAGVARPKNSLHSLGTIPCDVTIASHTIVNVLGKIEAPQAEARNFVPVKIADVMRCDNGSFLSVSGHTNSEITPMVPRGGQLCIVDDVWKLEIRLQNFVHNDLKENTHVVVSGKIYNNSIISYVVATDLTDITVTGQASLSEEDLLKGTQIPKRKAEVELPNMSKQLKLD